MSNSYASVIAGLYSGIFKDARQALPTVDGLERDENRILSSIKTRGLRSVTIDLPAFGKHFDKCLSVGVLSPSHIPNFGRSKRRVGPRLFQGLLSNVFSKDGLLLSQPCVTSIFFIRQLSNAARKLKAECAPEVRYRTLEKYIAQEQSLRSPSLNWHGDLIDCRWSSDLRIDDPYFNHGDDIVGEYPSIDADFCDIVHTVADIVSTQIGYFFADEWRPKHGPGAVADLKGGEYKYDFPTWSDKLESVFPYADLAFANYACWADYLSSEGAADSSRVPSVVLTVPKSAKGPRIIAKEPTANMWCQQMIRDFLESQIATSCISEAISFRDQSKNSDAALVASTTGYHWTVDLSDASDRMSLWLVERLFRRNKTLLEALSASRSTICTVPLRKTDYHLTMRKFAPQGSATTFPLQTIVYAILAIASVLYARGKKPERHNIVMAAKEVQVFGDDTIIPTDSGRQYVEILTYCGFLVNHSKTFQTGLFRESCGMEAYDGADVTPAYITNPYTESDTSSVASTVECSNNFFKKGLWHAAAALESTIPPHMQKALRVVGPGDGRFGLTSFCGERSDHLQKRWNDRYHRMEERSLSITAKVEVHQPGGVGHLLQYYTEAPTQDIHWMSGAYGRPSASVRRRWEPCSGD
nr:MAG: putative replicase protein [Leviviridae sp.]